MKSLLLFFFGGGVVKKRKRNLLFQKIHIGSPNLCYNVYLHMFFFSSIRTREKNYTDHWWRFYIEYGEGTCTCFCNIEYLYTIESLWITWTCELFFLLHVHVKIKQMLEANLSSTRSLFLLIIPIFYCGLMRLFLLILTINYFHLFCHSCKKLVDSTKYLLVSYVYFIS